jgi:hypothetical protein
MDRVRFIEHNGKKVLFLDFSYCQPEEVIEIMDECKRIVTSQPKDSVLTFSDMTEGQFTKDGIQRMKEVAAYDRPFVRRAALIGNHAASDVVHKSIMDFSQRYFRRFDSREEALDWLTSEAEESATA